MPFQNPPVQPVQPLGHPTGREALTIRLVVNIVIGLIVVGVALWLINTYIPIAGSTKDILNIVVVVATCVLVLQAVGLWSSIIRVWHKVTAKAEREADLH
jgi:hypothetical protein